MNTTSNGLLEMINGINAAYIELHALNDQLEVDDCLRQQGVTRKAFTHMKSDLGMLVRISNGKPFQHDGSGVWQVVAVGSLDGYMVKNSIGQCRVVPRTKTFLLQSDYPKSTANITGD